MSSRHFTTTLGLVLLLNAAPLCAAGPTYWDWRGADGLQGVRLEGASLDADGSLVRGLVALVRRKIAVADTRPADVSPQRLAELRKQPAKKPAKTP